MDPGLSQLNRGKTCFSPDDCPYGLWLIATAPPNKSKFAEQIFLGPPELARVETGGADQWALKSMELPGFAIVNEKKLPHPWDTHYQFSIKLYFQIITAR